MLPARQVSFFTVSKWISYLVSGLLLISSCTIPTKIQHGKPFVFKTNISIEGPMKSGDRRMLEEKLQNQLDDSLKARFISYAGVVKILPKPPVYDTNNVNRSILFMYALLNSEGYFNPTITWKSDTNRYSREKAADLRKKGEYRVIIDFKVTPGKLLHIDSVGYSLETPDLQQLALKNTDESLVKKNEAYSDQKVSAELDRLLNLFRDNGYYKIGREDLYAERDTVVAALIDPTLDPFEQVRLLDSLRKKRENPTITVVFRQRPVYDSTHIWKYYIGNITVKPDLYLLEDSLETKKDTAMIRGLKFLYSTRQFKLPFIARHIPLRPGTLYQQRRYYRTINNLNQLGAWQNVDVALQERYDSVPLVDAFINLYPARKLNLTIDYEVSRNVSDFLTTGQLFGIGLNLGLLNRNAFREAIQTTTSARFGIELGTHLIQTLQASLDKKFSFPKFIIPFKIDSSERIINPHTFLNLNAAYTDRKDFFRVRSFNIAWGYEWTRRRRRTDPLEPGQEWRKNWQFTPFNFEYTNVTKTPRLDTLERIIPSLRFAFNDGLIMSQILSLSTGFERDKRFTLIRGKIEQSGFPYGLIRRLEIGDLRSFIKIDAEYKHYITYKNSSWAFRGYAGYGYVYGKTDTSTTGVPKIVNESNLPFFKAFFAGGPYSMRAWPVRRLGPGSSNLYDPKDTSSIDRFGNMQLEFNTEYRFNITTIGSVKIASALFVDIGNIWSKEFTATHENIPEASFRLDHLYRDIAVGGGTSLRLDFDIFLIRLDWAYKFKDPLYNAESDGGWFHKLELFQGQFQLGIGYPF